MPEKLWAGLPRRITKTGVDGLITTNLANGSASTNSIQLNEIWLEKSM